MRLDSSNQFQVLPVAADNDGWLVEQTHGLKPEKLYVHNIMVKQPLVFEREEALNLAAWLSVLADPVGKDFERLVQEIKKT